MPYGVLVFQRHQRVLLSLAHHGRGDTDTINSTVLILIGISAGTALGSAIVSKNEAATAAASGTVPSRPAVVYPGCNKSRTSSAGPGQAGQGRRQNPVADKRSGESKRRTGTLACAAPKPI